MQKKSAESFETSETIHSTLTTHKGDGPVSCSDCMKTRISPIVLCEDDIDSDITFMKFPGIADNVDDQNETLNFKNDVNENVPCASGRCSLIYHATFTAGIDTYQKNGNTEDTLKVVEDKDYIPLRSPTKPSTNDESEWSLTIKEIVKESEMIAHLVDPTIRDEKLQFRFIDERGVDINGVSPEAYTCFWVEFLDTSEVGETEQVPIVKASMRVSGKNIG